MANAVRVTAQHNAGARRDLERADRRRAGGVDGGGAAFTNVNYVVDFSFTKAPYASYMITDVRNDASPNTIKQGYIRFVVIDNDKHASYYTGLPGLYSRSNGRFAFIIRKIL